MNPNTISILGCGWLGLPLGVALIQKDFVVKGSTTREQRLTELSDAGIIPYLIRAEQGHWEGERLIDFLECDTLIIAIPPGTRKNSNSTHAIEVKNLLQLISEKSISIRRIVYISSTSVYTNTNQIVEEGFVRTIEDAENKVLAEAELFVRSSKAQTLIFRLGGLTGYNRMLARFFAGKNALAGGNEPVNLLHRDDAIGAILFVIEQGRWNEIYNVCSPEHPLKKVFYTDLCKRFDLEAPGFPEELNGPWKLISTEKIQKAGYLFIFSDPHKYTYS